jgi:3-oxoacyl-[acyl-carrier protein] reductase
MEETMDYGLQGKVALVTGTASQKGIGKAVCLTLAKEGCDIISASRHLEGAKQTAAAVTALGRKAIAFEVDVANSAAVLEMVKTALKTFGKIDILINNAGVMAGAMPFLDSTREKWEPDMSINLYGTINCCKAVLPGMVERKWGKIVNYSSIAAKLSGPDSYAVSKAAVLTLTRGLASQFGPSGINVNAIAPGMVDTNLFGNKVNKEMLERSAQRTPLRRVQTVEDMANATAFLVSDVSRNITGQCLMVDSGLVML